jgi:hypothetical protein
MRIHDVSLMRKPMLNPSHPCPVCNAETALAEIEPHPLHANFEVHGYLCGQCGPIKSLVVRSESKGPGSGRGDTCIRRWGVGKIASTTNQQGHAASEQTGCHAAMEATKRVAVAGWPETGATSAVYWSAVWARRCGCSRARPIRGPNAFHRGYGCMETGWSLKPFARLSSSFCRA